MSRPLLIALLTVAAVAWPAAAQGLPVAAPDAGLPLDATTPTASDEETPISTAGCRPYSLIWEASDGLVPEFNLRVDPDGCVNHLIDEVWPFLDPRVT